MAIWSSNSTNRGFIERALEDAAKSISADVTVDIKAVIDRDTLGVAGWPDIRSAIFSKIEECHAFVGDVSTVGRVGSRFVYNSNVLIELGYVLKTPGENRLILVNNTAFGRIEHLPFDLRGRRTIGYSMMEAETDRSTERKRLARTLEKALLSVAEDARRKRMPASDIPPRCTTPRGTRF